MMQKLNFYGMMVIVDRFGLLALLNSMRLLLVERLCWQPLVQLVQRVLLSCMCMVGPWPLLHQEFEVRPNLAVAIVMGSRKYCSMRLYME